MTRKKKDVQPHVIHDSCYNCRFWRRLDDGHQIPDEDVLGECKRHPPTVIGIDLGTEGPIQSLPELVARDWCGDHQRAIN